LQKNKDIITVLLIIVKVINVTTVIYTYKMIMIYNVQITEFISSAYFFILVTSFVLFKKIMLRTEKKYTHMCIQYSSEHKKIRCIIYTFLENENN